MNEKPLAITVDDDPAISRIVQMKLQHAGFTVERVMTAEAALELIEQLHPDVIITDVKMPGMSGIEMCRECERFFPQWDFVMIVLTSQLNDADREYVESDPRRRFLQKPFSPRKLLAVVEECRERLSLQPA